jgi:malonate-semialdehyde dehydrogenase (acetylating)/methylmalonate-semialdehyde dehydrogenase
MAADSVVSAAYGSAGERCMALSVAVAVGDVAGPLVEALAARLPKLKVGDGTHPDTDIGPLITAGHRDKVAGYIGAGAEAGATLVVDGRRGDLPPGGFFLGTTLLDHVTPEMTVYTDEIFGPVLCVVRADTYEEGLALINSNRYANGTAIFTRDGGAARQFQFDVEVGLVGINVTVRRLAHVWRRGDELLHQRQGRHLSLARPGHLRR